MSTQRGPGDQPISAQPLRPLLLTVAAVLVALEALAVAVQGVVEIAVLNSARMTMGVTTAVFFLAYAAGLALCAWGLWHIRAWARSPVVVTQILFLFIAWSFKGGATTVVAITLAVISTAVLGCLFSRPTLRLLSR